MIKLIIFVHCNGWENGGYKNTLYFESVKQAEEWLFRHPHCERISIERITEKDFSDDFISLL